MARHADSAMTRSEVVTMVQVAHGAEAEAALGEVEEAMDGIAYHEESQREAETMLGGRLAMAGACCAKFAEARAVGHICSARSDRSERCMHR